MNAIVFTSVFASIALVARIVYVFVQIHSFAAPIAWPADNQWYFITQDGVPWSDEEQRSGCEDTTKGAAPSQESDMASQADCDGSGQNNPEYNPGSENPQAAINQTYTAGYFYSDPNNDSDGCTNNAGQLDDDTYFFRTRIQTSPEEPGDDEFKNNNWWWTIETGVPDGIAEFYVQLHGAGSDTIIVRYETGNDNSPLGEPIVWSQADPTNDAAEYARSLQTPDNFPNILGSDDNQVEWFIDVQIPLSEFDDNLGTQMICEGDTLSVLQHSTGEGAATDQPFHKDTICPQATLLNNPLECISDPIVISEPEFIATKTVANISNPNASNPVTAVSGDEVEFTVTLQNTGGPLANISYVDLINDGTLGSTVEVTYKPNSLTAILTGAGTATASLLDDNISSAAFNLTDDSDSPDPNTCDASKNCRGEFDANLAGVTDDEIKFNNNILFAKGVPFTPAGLYDIITFKYRAFVNAPASTPAAHFDRGTADATQTDFPQYTDYPSSNVDDQTDCVIAGILNCNDQDVDNDDPTPLSVIASADLEISKTTGVDECPTTEGAPFSYIITVTNKGPDDATNIVVTDGLPATVTVDSSDPEAGTNYAAGTWSIPSLANGATATLTLHVYSNAGTMGTDINNTATITDSDQGDSSTVNNSSSATCHIIAADLHVEKSALPTSQKEGENVTFTIDVTNEGPDDATNVTLSDLIPANTTYVSDNGAGAYDDATGVWTIGTILVDDTKSLELTVNITPNVGTEEVTNVAIITNSDQDDPDPSDNQDDVTVPVVELLVDIGVSKNVVGDATPIVGDNVTFALTVTNSGPDQATGVVVTDTLPTGLTYVSNTAPSQGSYNSGTGVWTVGTLASGASATMEITASVNADTATQTLTNVLNRTATDQPDGNPNNDMAQASVIVEEEFISCTDVDPAGLTVDCSEKLFPDPQKAKGVCLTRDDLFFDMFTSTPLCTDLKYSMLATNTNQLLPNVQAEIIRLADGRTAPDFEIRIFGRERAVAENVRIAVEALGIDPNVERTGGTDREETALLSSTILITRNPGITDICIADNIIGIDTISMAAVAAHGSPQYDSFCPQMLTDRSGQGLPGIHETVVDFLVNIAPGITTNPIDQAIISGGLAAVPQQARQDLQDLGLSLIEFNGATRFETSALINGQYFPAPTTAVGVNGRITNIPHPTNPRLERHGVDHYAALIGAHIAANIRNAALVLFDNSVMPDATKNYLQSKAGTISTGWIVGNVPANIVTEFLNLI